MARVFEDNSRSIGGTPLVRLNRIVGTKNAVVLAKIEGRNPSYSIKDRMALGIIEPTATQTIQVLGVTDPAPSMGGN